MAALMLKSNDSDIDSLREIGEYYLSFTNNFLVYERELRSIPRSGYRQQLTTGTIDGLTQVASADFYADEVNVYDFKSWSDEVSKVIINDIRPIKENLPVYDQQLDDLYKQVTVDSMTVENELANLTEKMFFEQLSNYDPNPLPALVFNFKVDEITFYSFRNHAYNNGHLDTANIDLKIRAYKDLFEKYNWVENAYHNLAKINVAEKSDLYSDYVTKRFGDVNGLATYIAEKGEEVNEKKSDFVSEIDELEEIARWGIGANDTIPLFTVDSTSFFIDSLTVGYKTLTIDSLAMGYVVTGLQKADNKIKNFSSIIGFDRIVDTLYTKPLDFKIDTISIAAVRGWSQSYPRLNEGDHGFIYVTEVQSESGPYSNFQISNLLPDTGIKWSSSFENPFTIIDLRIDTNTSLIVVKMGELAEDGETKEVENLVFNFDGKLLLIGN
jgi:hypothetical protein